MSSLIYESVVYMLEATVSVVFTINLLDKRYHNTVMWLIWCEIVVAAMLITPPFTMLRTGIILLLEFGFTMFFYKDAFVKKVMIFALKQGLFLASSLIAFLLYYVTTEIRMPFWQLCRSDNCTYCLLYLLLCSVTTSLVFQFLKGKRHIERPWVIGTQLILMVGEIAAVLAIAYASGNVIHTAKSHLAVAMTICMILANICVEMLAPYLQKRIALSANMDYGEVLSSMEFKYYETALDNEKKISLIRHDISNHIQTVSALFMGGDNQRAIEMMDELKKRYAYVERIVYCDNPVINVILSNKKREAEKQNIETRIDIKEGLDDLPITDYDLATVICNLFDNAVRGCICSEQSSPKLIVEIIKKNRYLVIRILNSCKITMNIESTDQIESTKNETQAHGIGMPIVAGIAKKYGGDFVASAQNGIFTATVILSLKNSDT